MGTHPTNPIRQLDKPYLSRVCIACKRIQWVLAVDQNICDKAFAHKVRTKNRDNCQTPRNSAVVPFLN